MQGRNCISHCFAHTVKLMLLKMRASFTREELNLSLAEPGVLSLVWWKQQGGVSRAEMLHAPV